MKPVVLMTDSHALQSDEVQVVHLPLIGIRKLQSASTRHHYDWLILTSKNAVTIFFEDYPHVTFDHIASIGVKTTKAIEAYGYAVDYEPQQFDQESFLAHSEMFADHSVCLACSKNARPLIYDALNEIADVDRIFLYEPVTLDENVLKAQQMLRTGSIDAMTFMSPSAVRGFFTSSQTLDIPVIAIGHVTGQALKNVQQPYTLAAQATKESMIQKILEMRENNEL